jgi:hypothetical protein
MRTSSGEKKFRNSFRAIPNFKGQMSNEQVHNFVAPYTVGMSFPRRRDSRRGQKELDSCFRRKDKLRKLRTRTFLEKRYCKDLSKFEL